MTETIEFYGYSDDTVIAEKDGHYKDAGAFDMVRVCEITAPDGSQVCVFGTYCPNNQGNGWGFGIMQAGDEDGAPVPEWARNVRFERNDDPDYSVRMYLDAPEGSTFRWLGEDDEYRG
jgi:hypothetical protein